MTCGASLLNLKEFNGPKNTSSFGIRAERGVVQEFSCQIRSILLYESIFLYGEGLGAGLAMHLLIYKGAENIVVVLYLV